ncbi:unnamed protein product [Onchocerca ochengi]|uniref:Reverse transcriptase domain-containing protein n=1 Tax=Onchocerca ochengi TaxID=42157 RepID=A0A182EL14_ONCOC|nr:unnamed protein product [Onchocerca ochengi]
MVKPTKTTNPSIDRFWKLEIRGIQEDLNLHDEEHVLEKFRENINKINGRHQVPWPWKEKNFKLNDNLAADIAKAYLQLELLLTERNYTPFLWLKDIRGKVTEDNVEHYRFQQVPFGVISSPFFLSATLSYHLESHGIKLARQISKNLYVDNITLSSKDTCEALANYKEMKTIFGDASMNIREFLSNDKEFNARIPEQDRAEEIQIKKILGIYWNSNTDVIQMSSKPWKDDREPTK